MVNWVETEQSLNLVDDILDLFQRLASSLHPGRRLSKNRSLLDFVLSLHELIYSLQDEPAGGAKRLILKELSDTVSDVLPLLTSALNVAIERERRPFADRDDGDPLEDEFIKAFKQRSARLTKDIQSAPAAEAASLVIGSVKELRRAILAELRLQASRAYL